MSSSLIHLKISDYMKFDIFFFIYLFFIFLTLFVFTEASNQLLESNNNGSPPPLRGVINIISSKHCNPWCWLEASPLLVQGR